MYLLVVWIYILSAIHCCASFPISATLPIGEQNAFILGLITFFICGFAIVGCVCCRRSRNKGFELDYEKDQKEFQNESGTLDANKTEYPIFRALSPSSDSNQRNSLNSNGGNSNHAVSNSNENLIANDIDNNNGPISTADLENIENNNAIGYIHSENEINMPTTSQNIINNIPSTSNANEICTNNQNDDLSTARESLKSINDDNILQNIIINKPNIIENNDIRNIHHHNYDNNSSYSMSSLNASKHHNIMMMTSKAPKTMQNSENFHINMQSSNRINVDIHKSFDTNNFYEIHNNDDKTTTATAATTTPLEQTIETTKISLKNEKLNLENFVPTTTNTKIFSENTMTTTITKNCMVNDIELKHNNEIEKLTFSNSLHKINDLDIVNITLHKDENTIETSSHLDDITNQVDDDNEENSVEEALRELDNVIADVDFDLNDDEDRDVDYYLNDDYDDDDDDDGDHDGNKNDNEQNEGDENHDKHLHYVIQQLLINNNINKDRLMLDFNDETQMQNITTINENNDKQQINNKISSLPFLQNNKESDNCIDFEMIRNVAETLIDNIIKESQRIAEKRKINYNNAHKIKSNIVMEIKENTSNSDSQLSFTKNNVKEIQNDDSNDMILRSKSLEDIFPLDIDKNGDNENVIIKTSTPCVHSKYFVKDDKQQQQQSLPNKFSKKCLENLFESSIKTTAHQNNDDNNHSSSICSPTSSSEEGTFIITTLSPIENKIFEINDHIFEIENRNIENENKTFEVNNKTFDACNKTFDVGNKTIEIGDKTFEIGDKTFDLPPPPPPISDNNDYGDPCTSKQALRRIIYKANFGDDVNSDEMQILTPMNTPIELSYPLWNQMMQQKSAAAAAAAANSASNNQNTLTIDDNYLSPFPPPPPPLPSVENETFDLTNDDFYANDREEEDDGDDDDDDDDDEEAQANLKLTFEALKKQLTEILPQAQGLTATGPPPEYSDDEDDNESGRTFDEYRSPFDGILDLLNSDGAMCGPPVAPMQNEVFINYKRSLSPIMEESEDEITCKTFNITHETKCMDSPTSNSSGCIETGEAIMGVTKTLMASNDTLFNFEDTLGEKEDVYSPRISSRNDIPHSSKSAKSTNENSLATPTESSDTEKGSAALAAYHVNNGNLNLLEQTDIGEIPITSSNGRKTPPKSIDFSELKQDYSELCSPDQQKTFSDGTSSTTTTTTTDRMSSSDLSPTVDHDTTFTTNTVDEKTCVTVIIKDDERISEISEPEWGSASCDVGGDGGGLIAYDLNSLNDVPSLDFNTVNNYDNEEEKVTIANPTHTFKFEENHDLNDEKLSTDEENLSLHSINNDMNDDDDDGNEKDSYHDDSGHSTQASVTTTTTTTATIDDRSSASGTQEKQTSEAPIIENIFIANTKVLKDRKECKDFLLNEIKYSSLADQSLKDKIDFIKNLMYENDKMVDEQFVDELSKDKILINRTATIPIYYQTKVQTEGLDMPKTTVIHDGDVDYDNDKGQEVLCTTVSYGKSLQDELNDIMAKAFHGSYEQLNDTNTLLANKTHFECDQNDDAQIKNENLEYKNEIVAQLSGEEDPWAEPVKLRTTETINNEWDSDAEDSHSSEEFMYISGCSSARGHNYPTIKANEKVFNQQQQQEKEQKVIEDEIFNDVDDNPKPKKTKTLTEEDFSEDAAESSSSEFEGEFIPSCWNSMALPTRSALKSPEKTNKNKKHRNVAFKKQRYHSVYEYPRECTSLSSAYSESSLWDKNYEGSYYCDTEEQKDEEFNSDGFKVTSSMRPFHGCQFNAFCHTWPTDSDFSWSQMQDEIDGKLLEFYSNIELKSNDVHGDGKKSKTDNKRPDSGVGESAEMLSDRISSIGELCHTKSNLHLPLNLLSKSPSQKNSLEMSKSNVDNNGDNDFSNSSSSTKNNTITTKTTNNTVVILPTPSCTGSMDSLSSNSSSDRHCNEINSVNNKIINNDSQISKTSICHRINNENILINNDDDDDGDVEPTKIFHHVNGDEDDNEDHNNHLDVVNDHLHHNSTEKIKQNDSTDEDSGIESIMKINK